ncbi:MAG: aromatic aminobenezylarsenical efflux permease ArsG family transporter [Pseudomonadota bacterium]
MSEYIFVFTTSIWLGVLTSISPCPLATNIAAISYIGRKSEHRRYVLLSGLLYTLGRVLTYILLAFIIVSGLYHIPSISNFLQTHMGKILGPILIVTGMFLLGWLNLNFKGLSFSNNLQNGVDKFGIFSALPIGAIFAISFCPVSAAIFFGSLIPLALNHDSRIIIPSLYGIGTAIPVIVFSFIMAFAAHLVGKIFNKITKIEILMRRITGVIFILVGIYLSLVYIFEIRI